MSCSYSPTPQEIMYNSVQYHKPIVIQGLLRYLVDLKEKAKVSMNTELICIYLDIDRALENCGLSEKQRLAVNYYTEGWTETQICEKMDGVSHQAVHKLLNKSYKKIAKYLSSC